MTLQPDQNLPSITPDLLVRGALNRGWRIESLSPALAHPLGLDPEAARGRFVDALFGESIPPLGELIDEALRQEEPLSDIPLKLTLGGSSLHLLGRIEPLGLTPDFRERLVAVTLQRQDPDAVEAVSRFGLVGQSAALREVLRKIERYGGAEAAVVITGETGTGKELVAAALHAASSRHGGPLVAVNCAAVSQELLESELFGHEKGAFTGAVRSHRGRFERADGGTLFLDEIGDMPPLTQAKLLRVLETGRIERVGAEQERSVDVRVVCATNVPLEQAVGEGRFRADLYHRLAVLRIHLPPLRERSEDIPSLADHFLQQFARKYERPRPHLTAEAVQLLRSYLWPGNVRELRNVLERVLVETESDVIGVRAFAEWVRERGDFTPGGWDLETRRQRPAAVMIPPYPGGEPPKLLTSGTGGVSLGSEPVPETSRSGIPANLSAGEIRNAYRAAGGNLSAAARRLGVHRATLYRYLKRLGLDREEL